MQTVCTDYLAMDTRVDRNTVLFLSNVTLIYLRQRWRPVNSRRYIICLRRGRRPADSII